MKKLTVLLLGLAFSTSAIAAVSANSKNGVRAGANIEFTVKYCHFQLTPAAKRFVAKAHSADPSLYDAEYASDEKGLEYDDNEKPVIACDVWYGDYLKGGKSYRDVGFEPFLPIAPE